MLQGSIVQSDGHWASWGLSVAHARLKGDELGLDGVACSCGLCASPVWSNWIQTVGFNFCHFFPLLLKCVCYSC